MHGSAGTFQEAIRKSPEIFGTTSSDMKSIAFELWIGGRVPMESSPYIGGREKGEEGEGDFRS